MNTDHSDAVINLLKILFDHFFYPIEARKFEIFDLKCGYKSGHLDINLKYYQKYICCCPFTQISGQTI